ncbi:unnamed protein product [Caenorhabditis angaria]|uniref:Uncharacterized protein n=1 Tax=Caenorhabditis angaria TaxID=860376 RepID=A0A9P1J211_9PELO|nr:unnamed protein product [Caenorhabditis angaria]
MNIVFSFLKAIFFAIFVAIIYAIFLLCYPNWLHSNEYSREQNAFETACINVGLEKTRISAAVAKFQILEAKYTLSADELTGIYGAFVNKTTLNSTFFNFYWKKNACNLRMFQSAFMLIEDSNTVYYTISSRVAVIIIRTILPIMTVFILGSGASAIHTILAKILTFIMRIRNIPAMTTKRNNLTKARDVFCTVLSFLYLLFCLLSTSYAISKWQNCGFHNGIKKSFQLMSTIPPTLTTITILDAYKLAGCFLHLNTGMALFIFSIMRLFRTWKYCKFDIPVMSQIIDAHNIDKDVQLKKLMKKYSN